MSNPQPAVKEREQLVKRHKAQAAAFPTKETHAMLVFTSALGPNLYFNKSIFKNEQPQNVTITLTWETIQGETHEQTKQRTA